VLGWLAALPPVAIYAVLGLLAAVENVIPPVPADAAVLLGAFLSHRGVTSPVVVFAVVWVCNVAGALGVYLLARRYGRRLFATPRGRRLLAPEAIAVIEREYLRFGLLGIFLARLLPGIRAVVPPFAGMIRLPPARVAVPIVAHSAIWYGGVTLAGSLIGAEWERLSALLGHVNRTLAYVAASVAVAWAARAYLRARRRRRERVWNAVTRALGDTDQPAAAIDPRAAAMLVLELAYADAALTPADRALVEEHLRERWGLQPQASRPAPVEPQQAKRRLAAYRARLAASVGQERRLALVEGMWIAAFADRASPGPEGWLLDRAGELLGLTPDEVAAAAQRARTHAKER
jgi:membrane protein DedA with SNARE-associated domain/uncharacterized tellurite resistance protein B-like protein